MSGPIAVAIEYRGLGLLREAILVDGRLESSVRNLTTHYLLPRIDFAFGPPDRRHQAWVEVRSGVIPRIVAFGLYIEDSCVYSDGQVTLLPWT